MRRTLMTASAVATTAAAVAVLANVTPGAAAGLRAKPATASSTSKGTSAPPKLIVAHKLKPRAHAAPVGTELKQSALGTRVFANAKVGFALAAYKQATYPARTTDGGKVWRINGPQLHINAADAPEAVSFVGLTSSHTYYAYGAQVVDVTSNGGRTWWEAFLGEAVVAVSPGFGHDLLAYAQGGPHTSNDKDVPTWQYVSGDGGQRWHYSTVLGG